MNKYVDALPINSRITVDYTKPNDPVKFEYPIGEDSIKKQMLSFIFFPILLLWMIVLVIVMVSYGILINLDIFINTITTETSFTLSELLNVLYQYVLLCFVVFVPPLLISLYIMYNYNRFKYWFPKLQVFITHFLSPSTLHTFTVNELKSPVYEIPLFRNVILTYEASGDFSKYLQRVEIKEHNFCYNGEKTQWLWKAKFIFSDIPMSGMLEGKFR